jgi:putative transposon-encoded protein
MENIETVYEKTATLFWNSGKAEVAKKYNEKRVYPILLKD